MARILVLDGHSAAALSLTRSAGRAGHWVAVGANRGLFAAAKLSRYCRKALDYPVSTSEAEASVDSILEFVKAGRVDLFMPVTDWTLGPLSAERERFSGMCHLYVMFSYGQYDSATRKFDYVNTGQNPPILFHCIEGAARTSCEDFSDVSASSQFAPRVATPGLQ